MAKVFHRRAAELITGKRDEEYKDVISLMRTKLPFALLKSVLDSARGFRGRSRRAQELPISSISFNVVPHGLSYESFILDRLSVFNMN